METWDPAFIFFHITKPKGNTMIKENFTYQGIDGDDITEQLYFHLTKRQIIQMAEEGWGDRMLKIANSERLNDKIELIEHFIAISIGHRKVDDNGTVRFVHYSEQELAEWKSSDAYDEFLFSMVSDPTRAVDFINNLIPTSMIAKANQELRHGK